MFTRCPCFATLRYVSTRGWVVEVGTLADRYKIPPANAHVWTCSSCDARYVLHPAPAGTPAASRA